MPRNSETSIECHCSSLAAALANTTTRNLWLLFAPARCRHPTPGHVRGDGVTIFDDRGKSYLDALSGLFVVQVGYGPNSPRRPRRQAGHAGVFPALGYATRRRSTAERPTCHARGPKPGKSISGGTEAVEHLEGGAKYCHRQPGQTQGHFTLDRLTRHHPGRAGDHRPAMFGAPFEPLTPGGFRVPTTNFYEHCCTPTSKSFRAKLTRIAEAIEFEGPDTVAAVFLESVQNAAAASRRRRVISNGSAR